MNTEKNFGISKPKAIALFFQMILIVVATLATAYVLGFSIASGAGALFTSAYCVVLISYFAIIFYASYGYKKDNSYYLGAIYAFCAAILINVLLPFRTTFQIATLTVLFGLYIAFAQRLNAAKAAEWLLLCMMVFALAFSIHSTATARTENLNELSTNFFSVSAMYVSIWTPVIMTATLALCYSVRRK